MAKFTKIINEVIFMYKMYNNTIKITAIKSDNRAVVIPEKIDGIPVTTIGEKAFKWRSSLKEITIPDSVTEIEDYAFIGCSSLERVHLTDNITHIGNGAFMGCEALKKAIIPKSITHIKYRSFYGCAALENVECEGVGSIGSEAFANCLTLKTINLPDGVDISSDAFTGCPVVMQKTANDTAKELSEEKIKDLARGFFYYQAELYNLYDGGSDATITSIKIFDNKVVVEYYYDEGWERSQDSNTYTIDELVDAANNGLIDDMWLK